MGPVIRQDYLLRMIEQAARMLARLTGLQAEHRTGEAMELSQQAAEQWLGLNVGRLRELDDEGLIEHLRRQGALPEVPVRVGVAVNLLRSESERLARAGNDSEALELKATALCVLLRTHILGLAPDLPDFTPRPTVFLHELPDDALPDRAAVLLVCYHEHVGNFGRAEDVLHNLKHRTADVDWVQELGTGFYERLLRHTDAELVEGNLPRHEVAAAAHEWQRANNG